MSNKTGGDFDYGVLQFSDAERLHITGSGVVNGQGYDWWVSVLSGHGDHRPHLFLLDRCSDVEVDSLLLKDSPMFHLKIHDVQRLHVHDLEIFVDVFAQKSAVNASFLPVRTRGRRQLEKRLTF